VADRNVVGTAQHPYARKKKEIEREKRAARGKGALKREKNWQKEGKRVNTV